jgi:hypothetical protein
VDAAAVIKHALARIKVEQVLPCPLLVVVPTIVATVHVVKVAVVFTTAALHGSCGRKSCHEHDLMSGMQNIFSASSDVRTHAHCCPRVSTANTSLLVQLRWCQRSMNNCKTVSGQ